MKQLLAVFFAAITLAGCTETVSKDGRSDILMMGDSMFASHSLSGRSVGSVLERKLGQEVTDRSVLGARMIYRLPITGAAGLNIPKQYRAGDWDWVIVNGGGNDLWLGCGCHACDRKIEKLAARDLKSGTVLSLLSRLRASGAQVVYVGYLRSPGAHSPIEDCKDEGDELEARIAAFAEARDGIHFVSLAQLVPHGDRSFHGFDMIHPSVKGSQAIAELIARVITQGPRQP